MEDVKVKFVFVFFIFFFGCIFWKFVDKFTTIIQFIVIYSFDSKSINCLFENHLFTKL